MKKNFVKGSIALIAFGTTAICGTAFAQVMGGATNNLETGGSINQSTSTIIQVDGEVGASAGVEAQSGMSDQGTTSTSSPAGMDGTFNAGVSVSAPINVTTDESLNTYTREIMDSDTSVSSISSGEGEVTVSYKHPGKFFGFIPVTVVSKTTVQVDEEDSVEVRTKLPWWSMFVTGVENVRSQIESKLQSSSQINASFSATATAQVKAYVIYNIISTIQAEKILNPNAYVDTTPTTIIVD